MSPDPLRQPAPTGPGTTPTRERPVLEEANLGPWRGHVRVIPITGLAGSAQVQFEVRAEWHGPGLIGLPPAGRPVDTTDTYVVDDAELARSIALMAIERLRRGEEIEPPDLRAHARELAP